MILDCKFSTWSVGKFNYTADSTGSDTPAYTAGDADYLSVEAAWDTAARSAWRGQLCPKRRQKTGKQGQTSADGLPSLPKTNLEALSKAAMPCARHATAAMMNNPA